MLWFGTPLLSLFLLCYRKAFWWTVMWLTVWFVHQLKFISALNYWSESHFSLVYTTYLWLERMYFAFENPIQSFLTRLVRTIEYEKCMLDSLMCQRKNQDSVLTSHHWVKFVLPNIVLGKRDCYLDYTLWQHFDKWRKCYVILLMSMSLVVVVVTNQSIKIKILIWWWH